MTDEELFKKKFPLLDVVALVRGESRLGHEVMYEQELNFDAGLIPEHRTQEIKCVEWIDGKKYMVYK